ncbi:Gfo/Idh/MocA family protein [Pleomorphovibrio marinus]|uniref:Gfo/Idh/MocA family protein n=1 Tax=Pleomorphovibrio marinus TaxID=2164132 RepID=UPI000E09E78C|nr:Gfo/Idh/MocA family oxidoreductase [Pleomorphovibrio marinus]
MPKKDGKQDRRKFLKTSSLLGTSLLIGSRFAFAGEPKSDKKVRIGVVGGRFGASFYFHEHPNCEVEAVSDLRKDRREHLMKVYGCSKSYDSLDTLLKDPAVEAVFLATPAPDHVSHTIASLEAGKHVLCAVPAALDLEDCQKLMEAVKRSGLTYMMAETSTFHQVVLSAQKFYREGKFGDIFRVEAQYHHPGLEELYFEDGKPTWRHGLPPMLYPTHCTSYHISVTGERFTQVSCLGWGDQSEALKGNPYQNPFWNETALFKTNRGNASNISICWRGALMGTERGEWHGNKMSLYGKDPNGLPEVKINAAQELAKDDGGFVFKKAEMEEYKQTRWYETDMLPLTLRHSSGHDGSHTFITHEFVDAIINNRRPQVDIHEALAYTVPGIVAHQSALKGGESMKIPTFDG